jgi:thioredoxin 1
LIDVYSLEQFRELISSNDRVVVKYWASWCTPCKRLAPHYKALAEASHDVVFLNVDIDECQDIALEYSVMAVPTVALFENGEWVRDLKERTAVKLISELKE